MLLKTNGIALVIVGGLLFASVLIVGEARTWSLAAFVVVVAADWPLVHFLMKRRFGGPAPNISVRNKERDRHQLPMLPRRILVTMFATAIIVSPIIYLFHTISTSEHLSVDLGSLTSSIAAGALVGFGAGYITSAPHLHRWAPSTLGDLLRRSL